MSDEVVENNQEVENQEVENQEVNPEDVNEELGIEKLNQEEFNKLYFQMKQQERELKALKEQQAKLQSNPSEEPLVTNEPKVPKLEDFDYDEEAYIAAKVQYEVDKKIHDALKREEEARRAREQELTQQQIAKQFDQKAAEFAAQNPDYAKVIELAGNAIQYSPAVQTAILSSEVGPQLDYMLLKNPQLVDKLNAMPEPQAYMEMGKLEIQLRNEIPTTMKRNISQAPEPIEDVAAGGSGGNTDFRYNDEMSMDEYYRQYMALKKS